MLFYFLFKPKVNDHLCSYIYAQENGKIVSYSYDDEYIVKAEEKAIKNFAQLEELFGDKKSKSKKSSQSSILVKKEFSDAKAALYYLEGSLDDFNESIPARKRLPEIVNPYDMDFEEVDEAAEPFNESSASFKKNFDDDDDMFNELSDDDGYNEFSGEDEDDLY